MLLGRSTFLLKHAVSLNSKSQRVWTAAGGGQNRSVRKGEGEPELRGGGGSAVGEVSTAVGDARTVP